MMNEPIILALSRNELKRLAFDEWAAKASIPPLEIRSGRAAR